MKILRGSHLVRWLAIFCGVADAVRNLMDMQTEIQTFTEDQTTTKMQLALQLVSTAELFFQTQVSSEEKLGAQETAVVSALEKRGFPLESQFKLFVFSECAKHGLFDNRRSSVKGADLEVEVRPQSVLQKNASEYVHKIDVENEPESATVRNFFSAGFNPDAFDPKEVEKYILNYQAIEESLEEDKEQGVTNIGLAKSNLSQYDMWVKQEALNTGSWFHGIDANIGKYGMWANKTLMESYMEIYDNILQVGSEAEMLASKLENALTTDWTTVSPAKWYTYAGKLQRRARMEENIAGFAANTWMLFARATRRAENACAKLMDGELEAEAKSIGLPRQEELVVRMMDDEDGTIDQISQQSKQILSNEEERAEKQHEGIDGHVNDVKKWYTRIQEQAKNNAIVGGTIARIKRKFEHAKKAACAERKFDIASRLRQLVGNMSSRIQELKTRMKKIRSRRNTSTGHTNTRRTGTRNKNTANTNDGGSQKVWAQRMKGKLSEMEEPEEPEGLTPEEERQREIEEEQRRAEENQLRLEEERKILRGASSSYGELAFRGFGTGLLTLNGGYEEIIDYQNREVGYFGWGGKTISNAPNLFEFGGYFGIGRKGRKHLWTLQDAVVFSVSVNVATMGFPGIYTMGPRLRVELDASGRMPRFKGLLKRITQGGVVGTMIGWGVGLGVPFPWKKDLVGTKHKMITSECYDNRWRFLVGILRPWCTTCKFGIERIMVGIMRRKVRAGSTPVITEMILTLNWAINEMFLRTPVPGACSGKSTKWRTNSRQFARAIASRIDDAMGVLDRIDRSSRDLAKALQLGYGYRGNDLVKSKAYQRLMEDTVKDRCLPHPPQLALAPGAEVRSSYLLSEASLNARLSLKSKEELVSECEDISCQANARKTRRQIQAAVVHSRLHVSKKNPFGRCWSSSECAAAIPNTNCERSPKDYLTRTRGRCRCSEGSCYWYDKDKKEDQCVVYEDVGYKKENEVLEFNNAQELKDSLVNEWKKNEVTDPWSVTLTGVKLGAWGWLGGKHTTHPAHLQNQSGLPVIENFMSEVHQIFDVNKTIIVAIDHDVFFRPMSIEMRKWRKLRELEIGSFKHVMERLSHERTVMPRWERAKAKISKKWFGRGGDGDSNEDAESGSDGGHEDSDEDAVDAVSDGGDDHSDWDAWDGEDDDENTEIDSPEHFDMEAETEYSAEDVEFGPDGGDEDFGMEAETEYSDEDVELGPDGGDEDPGNDAETLGSTTTSGSPTNPDGGD